MPDNSWLSEEYIAERLVLASGFFQEFSLEEFKIMFFVPADDGKICSTALKIGFTVYSEGNSVKIASSRLSDFQVPNSQELKYFACSEDS